jgi:TonB-linked SusC/RagA family outer membrane protein
MKKQLLLLAALAIACGAPAGMTGSHSNWGITAAAQTNSDKVTGVVKDSNGEPLIGVSVKVKGTTRGTVTDLDGRYSIKAPSTATLVFSYVGYNAVELPAAQAERVTLTNNEHELEEVVITGEFGMKRVARAVGSSAQNVKASDITESGRTDFITALQGRVSGMTVTNTSGAPGASTQVILRSATSISGNNQPLYIVDGIPMNNSTFNGGNSFAIADAVSVRDGDFSSRGNDFNPEDIESMTVLKGAAAAALYGSDASNGAIIITTKKGSRGHAKITYSNQLSWSKAYGWPKIQNKYTNGAYGATNYYYTKAYGGLYDGLIDTYDNTAAILQTGFMHRHNVSVQAGNDRMSIRGSASFTDQDGVIKTTNLKRQNISLAGRAELSKYVSFEGSMQYVHQSNVKAQRFQSGPLYRSYRWPNVDDMSNYMDADGVHMRYPNYYTDTDLLNPLFALYKNKNNDKTDRFITAMSLNITPIEHTYIKGQFGWDVSTSQYEYATHPYYRSNNIGSINGGSYNLAKYNTNDPTINILAGYNNTFNEKYTLGVQVGYHQRENGVTSMSTYGENFQVIDFYSINNCLPSTVVAKKKTTKRRLQGISGALELGYANMLFANFRFRNDWSSTLPKNNNHFFYPSVELSWVVTELPGLKNLGWLNYLKIRGAFAQVGKDAPALSIDPELEATEQTGGGYRYGYTGPNKALKPEMNTSWEVGFEARLWDNRVNADFTWFHTHCADQIVEGFRLSYATGFVLNNLNVGTFNTWGWEAHVDADLVKAGDFTWNLGINASHTKSKVVYLPENVSEYYNAYTWNSGNIRNGIMVGEPITSLTGRGYLRNDKGEVLLNPTTGMPIIDSKWKVLGDREPWLRYGITTSLSYKGFRLSAMFSGRFNATMVNGTSRAMVADGFDELSIRMREGGDNQFFGVYQDGHENPTYYTQRDAYLGNIPNGYKVGDEVPGSYNPNYSTSSVTPMAGSYYLYWMNNYDEPWVQKHIHYLRCQELRLSYNVPSAWLKKTTRGLVQNALIYVAGNDLFTLTNYQGYDVVGNSLSAAAGGVGGEGIDCWSLPSPRTYSLGLSVTF